MTTILYAELFDVDSFVWILMKPPNERILTLLDKKDC